MMVKVKGDFSPSSDIEVIAIDGAKGAVDVFSKTKSISDIHTATIHGTLCKKNNATGERLRNTKKKPEIDLLKGHKKNFYVNSYWWTRVERDDISLMMNNAKDIRHYCSWAPRNIEWEQLFTYEAALRETNKLGKKMPPSAQYYVDLIENKYHGNCKRFLEEESIPLCGQRNDRKWHIQDMGGEWEVNGCAYLWCEDGTYLQCYTYGYTIWQASDSVRKRGMSVRCIED